MKYLNSLFRFKFAKNTFWMLESKKRSFSSLRRQQEKILERRIFDFRNGHFLEFVFSPSSLRIESLKAKANICYYKSLGQRRGLRLLCPLMTSRLPYWRLKQLSSKFPPEIKLLFRKHFLWFWLWHFVTYCANAIWEFPRKRNLSSEFIKFDFWSMKPKKGKYDCKFSCELCPNSASLMNHFMAHCMVIESNFNKSRYWVQKIIISESIMLNCYPCSSACRVKFQENYRYIIK